MSKLYVRFFSATLSALHPKMKQGQDFNGFLRAMLAPSRGQVRPSSQVGHLMATLVPS